ncbi:MAG TPA: hypothetical protein VLJ78_07840 [Microvirga sp.]|nr:hypothetical protein [Microvirga sp.]
MGIHGRVFSLVLPVPAAALARSEAYGELDRELRSAPFARKLAWPLLDRRAGKLHATVCGSLASGDPPVIGPEIRDRLSRSGPLEVEVRGLFSGNVNIGRLYLRVYPECRAGENAIRSIQRIMGRRETDLYVIGIHNFIDDLDEVEAAALSRLLDAWWDRPLFRLRVDQLWLLAARDDLVLDSEVVETLPLVERG